MTHQRLFAQAEHTALEWLRVVADHLGTDDLLLAGSAECRAWAAASRPAGDPRPGAEPEVVMKHRKIKHVMTTDVALVRDYTDFKDIVKLLAVRGVSAAPVVDNENRVIGVVSNADLLAKQSQYETPGGLARLRIMRRNRARAKAAATVAADLMTTPAITIDPESTVVHGARLLAQHNIKRLPVIDTDGRLIGIVARQDLLSVFLRKDNVIRDEIVHDVFEHGLGVTVNPTTVDVKVHDGMVTLHGDWRPRARSPSPWP
jgi:CBS-domain-containing membrane protein